MNGGKARSSVAPPAANKPTNLDYEDFADMSKMLTEIVRRPEAGRYAPGDHLDPGQDSIGNIIDSEAAAYKEGEVPHFIATTKISTKRPFMVLFALSVVASIVYFAVRIKFLYDTETEQVQPGNDAKDEESELYRNSSTTYSLGWSLVVMAAELGGFVLTHIGQQMFYKQDTTFQEMSLFTKNQLAKIVAKKGKLQRIHIMVCTYSEPVETVEECVQHILDSAAPVYAEKMVYIGDDGASVPKYYAIAEAKLNMVRRLREKGYKNVFYVGDRVKLKTQLNGKSSNLNHMILNKIYPHVTKSTDVSWKDILMVMDCDHMLQPDYFQRCCAVMLDKDTAVCLVPQFFHNHVEPDCFDNTNTNFMFRLMPFYFGAGCCFITGTNVMVRARPCFLACRFDENPHANDNPEDNHRSFFSEILVAEDIDLGSRIHTLGYKSVFLCRVLALGEVPLPARDIWKQRSRWAKAAHLYILDRDSVFWKKQENMSRWQKSLYCIPLILHFIIIWAEPIMFSMPAVCVFGKMCPYGINNYLWVTHFVNLVLRFLLSTWADTWRNRRAALYAQTSSRVLFFVNCKAVLNTLMIYAGWKKAGAFKVTTKAAPGKKIGEGVERCENPSAEWHPNDDIAPDFWGYADDYLDSVELEDATSGPVAEAQVGQPMQPLPTTYEPAHPAPVAEAKPPREGFQLWKIHAALSKVTNLRKKVLPFEGTLDFWVLLFITIMNILAAAGGLAYAYGGFDITHKKAITDPNNPRFDPLDVDFVDPAFPCHNPPKANGEFDGNQDLLFSIKGESSVNLRLIATVFALVESAPGLLFIWYITFRRCAAWTLKIWVPFVICGISILLIAIEARVGVSVWSYNKEGRDIGDAGNPNCPNPQGF